MFFFNLSAAEFLTLLSSVSAVVVTLYLLSRSRQKHLVPTLKFWRNAAQPDIQKNRRRIQQPLSLILQLLSIALLLLALAQLRLGSRERNLRDHVLLLDTSSWMAAKGTTGTLLDDAKKLARQYVRSLPSTDRVMVVRADGLATPATALETDRQKIEDAIEQSRSGASALNLEQTLLFAAQVEKLHTRSSGEIVFVGAGRVMEQDGALQNGFAELANAKLRVIPVTGRTENVGLRKIGVKRSATDPGVWDIFVSVRNYSNRTQTVPFALLFGGAHIGGRRVTLLPGKEEENSFTFRTKSAGWLEARLLVDDALSEDNRAIIELPAQKPLKVAVYTDEPQLLRPAFAANPLVEAVFLTPAQYDPKAASPVVVFDRFHPKEMPKAGVIWIEPPAAVSPIKVRRTINDVPITRWRADHTLATGLRTKSFKLQEAQVYGPAEGDVTVAEVDAGPVIVARSGPAKLLVLGFHPGRSSMKFDLATPLLFANILRWMEPDVFRRWEIHAGSAGAVTVALDGEADPARVRVLMENNQPLPFTAHGNAVRFFAGVPGTVRVQSDYGEQVYSLTLPEVGAAAWEPPKSAARGIPAALAGAFSRDIWQWLALLGGLGLLAEWLLYGNARGTLLRVPAKAAARLGLRKAS